ncbi:MAG: tetratricopeptide repeat protein [bacterium]|nr:MAG: tetratricopeptide repeat protein [bacterium]
MMKLFTLIFIFIISILILPSSVLSQETSDTGSDDGSLRFYSEEAYQVALTNYVTNMLNRYYVESLPQERFLVALMRLVNNEMNSRIKNRREAIEKYFSDLKMQIDELQQLEERLHASGIHELDDFISELDTRMRMAVRSGEINYKQKKVFEDALQLLYIAEEMIKLDQLSDPSSLNRRISKSKDRLLNAFGEVGDLELIPLEMAPTIFNLFEEWRKTDSYKFSARVIDVKIARSKLIKSGNIEQVDRMLNAQLRYAYASFNYLEYDLAERLLEDLIETYQDAGVRDFEDVYFYWGESNFALNRFLKARGVFNQLLQEYPGSVYLSRAYGRLIQLSYKLGEYDEAIRYYASFQDVTSSTQEDYYDVLFVAALCFYENVDFNRAVEILLSIPQNSEYYFFSQYLVGTIYNAGQNYDLAYDVFESMATSKKTPPEFHNRALLKLSQISYERGDYLTSIDYATRIPGNFKRYDKVLNILLWSHFMLEKSRQPDPLQRDYTQAKSYAFKLLEDYYSSEYRMEAESLLGYMYQSENDLPLARDFYTDVYKSKMERNNLSESLALTDSMSKIYQNSVLEEEDALRQDNRDGYVQAAGISEEFRRKIWDEKIADKSNIGAQVSGEITDMVNQLSELNHLRKLAVEQENEYAIEKIDALMDDIKSSLNLYSEADIQKALLINSYPVAKKVALADFQQQKDEELRQDIRDEMIQIDAQLQQLSVEIERAKLLGSYDRVVALEQNQRHLVEIGKKYDQLYAYAMGLEAAETYAEFDRWGEFGAVGIIDVNFGQRDRLQDQMSQVSSVYNSIMDKITQRRQVVEDQLKKIEAEIRFMTMKARLEERQRLRAEREQSFRETYFDTRTSEFEEK